MIDVATREQVFDVALRMRDQDLAEFSAVTSANTRPEMAELLAERYASLDGVMCGYDDAGPICVGGTFQMRPNVMTLLFYATDDFPRIARAITRFTKKLLRNYEDAGIHRIEAVSMAEHKTAHDWLKTLGLEPETGHMRNYGKNGEAFIQFARVAHVRTTGT